VCVVWVWALWSSVDTASVYGECSLYSEDMYVKKELNDRRKRCTVEPNRKKQYTQRYRNNATVTRNHYILHQDVSGCVTLHLYTVLQLREHLSNSRTSDGSLALKTLLQLLM
jgi:hypothetical protein